MARSASAVLNSSRELDVDELWREYKQTEAEGLRNRLIEHYLPLVRYNAQRIHRKLPDEVDIDDLMGAGIFGLTDAVHGFDLSQGVKFETYSAPRIRGAILDELRAMDWVPRLVRSRTSRFESASRRLEQRLGRPPTDDEIAGELGLDDGESDKLRRDAGTVGVVSLNQKWFETDSNRDVREIDVIEDTSQPDPISRAEARDLKEMITKGLKRAERFILILYYYEQMTMKEIGATLDLSESRVSQMHSSILARLRSRLEDQAEELLDEGVASRRLASDLLGRRRAA